MILAFFSVYAAIVGIIASVASWKYDLAIMLPEKKDEDVQALFFPLGNCSFSYFCFRFFYFDPGL